MEQDAHNKTAIAREQCPSPRDSREMVRIIVDEMCLYELNPTRSDCFTVAKIFVKQYPKSFADILKDGPRNGSGYASLVNQLKTHVEHLSHDSMIARHRRVKGVSGPSTENSARGPLRTSTDQHNQTIRTAQSDQYGCIRWQCDFPQGEAEACLEEKQKEMKELYACEGPAGADRGHLA
ncbi:hypothetical protein AOLI_G00126320 [Acnodon oligacanthus]